MFPQIDRHSHSVGFKQPFFSSSNLYSGSFSPFLPLPLRSSLWEPFHRIMKRDTAYFCGYRRAALTKLGDLFYDFGLDTNIIGLNCSPTWLRRRRQKRHLKSEFLLFQTSSQASSSICQILANFYRVECWRLNLSSEQEIKRLSGLPSCPLKNLSDKEVVPLRQLGRKYAVSLAMAHGGCWVLLLTPDVH